LVAKWAEKKADL
jgi:hypothetical protein